MSVAQYIPFKNSSQILRYPENTKFNVFLGIAPLALLGEKPGLSLAENPIQLNLYHSGLLFQALDPNKQYSFTFDFDMAGGLSAETLLPTINADNTLTWNNESEVTLGTFIDRSYWLYSTYMTTITAANLVDYQKWILNVYLPDNSIYSLFAGITEISRLSIFNPVMRSSTCDDFCTASFLYFQNQLKCIIYPTPPLLNFQGMVAYNNLSTDFEQVSFSDYQTEIVDFYKTMNNLLISLMETLADIDKIIHTRPIDTIELAIKIGEFVVTLIDIKDFIVANDYIIYYYGLGNDNLPTYWRMKVGNAYINYIETNIKRNVEALDYLGNKVVDDYSLDGKCSCPCDDDDSDDIWTIGKIIVTTYIVLAVTVIMIVVLARR